MAGTVKVVAPGTAQGVVTEVVQADVEERVTGIVTISALIIVVTNVRELAVAHVVGTVLELVRQIAAVTV